MSFALPYLVIGLLLALLVGWGAARALRLPWSWADYGIGAAFFFLAGILQNLLVSPVAIAIHGIRHLQPLVPLSAPEAIYYGLAAGIAQEAAKAAQVAWRGQRQSPFAVALALGAGFASAEILFIALGALHAPLAGAGALLVPLWERLSAILFHIGAALVIAIGFYRRRIWLGLLAAVLLHAVADGAVGVLSYLHVQAVLPFESGNFVYSLAVLLVAAYLARREIIAPAP